MPYNNHRPTTTRGALTLLTNFDKGNLENYKKAIKAYKELIPKEEQWSLHICEASNETSDYGIWYSYQVRNGKGLSSFWRIYNTIKEGKCPYSNNSKRITMHKADLQSGMLMVFTKCDCEYRALVLDNELLFVHPTIFGSLSKHELSDDCHTLHGGYKLAKILKPNTPTDSNIGIGLSEFVTYGKYWTTVYEVEEPIKEFTMAELEAALGYKVKIIK